MTATTVTRGWQRPYRAKKAHYFIGGKSLCGHHTRLAHTGLDDDGSDRCLACYDKLDALIQKGEISAWSLVSSIRPTGTVVGQ